VVPTAIAALFVTSTVQQPASSATAMRSRLDVVGCELLPDEHRPSAPPARRARREAAKQCGTLLLMLPTQAALGSGGHGYPTPHPPAGQTPTPISKTLGFTGPEGLGQPQRGSRGGSQADTPHLCAAESALSRGSSAT
jgi:hypothetical protein